MSNPPREQKQHRVWTEHLRLSQQDVLGPTGQQNHLVVRTFRDGDLPAMYMYTTTPDLRHGGTIEWELEFNDTMAIQGALAKALADMYKCKP